MAHEIEVVSGKAAMAYAGATPWHELGTAVEEADLYDWEKFCTKSGLDWDAELVPLETFDTQQMVTYRAVRRKTDQKIIGVVGPRYTILQNKDAFKWFTPFLASKEASLHTAGCLCEGSRVWVLAKLQRDPLVIVPGDEIEKYLLLSHSHDGTLAVRVGFTPIRVVCANTLAMAHNSNASKLIRIKHSRSVNTNLDNIRDIVNLANSEFEATAEQYKNLATKNINQQDLKAYVKKVLEIEDDADASKRSLNQMEEVIRLFEEGRGNNIPSVKGTWWAAYNGFTEWLSYERGTENNRLNSLWFGDSANLNKKALEIALTMAV